MKNIKYIGKKAIKTDTIAGTGASWLPDQVLEIEDDAASKLVRHPDVWIDIDAKAPVIKVVEPIKVDKPAYEDDILALNKKADLEDYRVTHELTDVEFNTSDKVADMQRKLVIAMDQRFAPLGE